MSKNCPCTKSKKVTASSVTREITELLQQKLMDFTGAPTADTLTLWPCVLTGHLGGNAYHAWVVLCDSDGGAVVDESPLNGAHAPFGEGKTITAALCSLYDQIKSHDFDMAIGPKHTRYVVKAGYVYKRLT